MGLRLLAMGGRGVQQEIGNGWKRREERRDAGEEERSRDAEEGARCGEAEGGRGAQEDELSCSGNGWKRRQ